MAELIPVIDLPHLTSQFHSWWRFWGGSPCKHQRDANWVFMAPCYFIQLCFPMRGRPTGGSPLDSLSLMTFNHFVLKTVIFIAACIINSELHAHWFSNYTPFLQNKMIKLNFHWKKKLSQQFYFTDKVCPCLVVFDIFSCKLKACIKRLEHRKWLGQWIIVHWVCRTFWISLLA